jgi:hypothetical protein
MNKRERRQKQKQKKEWLNALTKLGNVGALTLRRHYVAVNRRAVENKKECRNWSDK